MRDAIVIGPGCKVPGDYNVEAYFLISSAGKIEDLGIASQLLKGIVHIVGKSPKAIEGLAREIISNWTGAVEDLLGIKEESANETFKGKLTNLINRYSKENGSNTPDFVLADYLIYCLEAYNRAVNHRDSLREDSTEEKVNNVKI